MKRIEVLGNKCCGCSACVNKCPKQCISMKIDEEGFLYPHIDTKNCIKCGFCEKVCFSLKRISEDFDSERLPLKTFAGYNRVENIRRNSSSGGIFTAIAEYVINKGGVVFGARFDDNWEVIHDYVETIDDLSKFRGSKYVQSIIGDTYKKAELFLKQGRLVLFSGSPCHISGLRSFLQKDYTNLLLVDFLCHGVPSPGVWKWYLKNLRIDERRKSSLFPVLFPLPKITNIEFRNKDNGWERYNFILEFEDNKNNQSTLSSVFSDNPFMKVFLSNIILRPSCYNCLSRKGSSGSDITIGDLWGADNIVPEINDDKGLSLLLVNTEFGKKIIERLNIVCQEIDFSAAIVFNPVWKISCQKHQNRDAFFKKYKQHRSDFDNFVDYVPKNPWQRRYERVVYILLKYFLK